MLAAYNALVPDFLRLYQLEGRDFARFYAAVRALAELPADERRAAMGAEADRAARDDAPKP